MHEACRRYFQSPSSRIAAFPGLKWRETSWEEISSLRKNPDMLSEIRNPGLAAALQVHESVMLFKASITDNAPTDTFNRTEADDRREGGREGGSCIHHRDCCKGSPRCLTRTLTALQYFCRRKVIQPP